MSEEAKMILKMVDEGKITPEQAVEMLKAVGSDDVHSNRSQNEHKGEEFVQDLDKWGKELAQKMGSAVKDLEPKLRKMMQIMVQNTMKTVEEVGKVFREQQNRPAEENENHEEEHFEASSDTEDHTEDL
ncbi:SHOCT-like domain-containing protein [Defluviitalea raffinosedens]|jgi:hypothetical protein|uniref:YvlB/LiaX N-terminal domain-containing protein n=1 Tax=Defluviitalea raffinosedens TaxID=1450156 RepID=A0A7C8HEB3_9FIRM|nr:hypothetical protein [Defluviitalea raffinosedens]KAE9633760.1 hypothetical protein GND95_08895 [Defluviitalea raffinosedens]MBM7686104.1 hypothetical protein [Defluviitalea raffinosedens]HHW68533.1 hypothetical protein [Candidatus Epulonipiscium sp.]